MAAILDSIIVKFVMGYYCVRPSILFYIHGPANLHFFESLKYHKITQFFLEFLLPKGNQVIGWHSWAYLPD